MSEAGAGVETTTITQPCLAYPQNSLAGGPQAAPTDFTFTTDGPSEVLVGETFTAQLTLNPIEIPLTNSGYTINNLGNVTAKIPDPTNAIVNSVTMGTVSTPGWAMSRSGGVTTLTNTRTFSPLPAPQVIFVPTLTYNLTANAPINNTIEFRLGGAPTYNDSSNPSVNFTINLSGVPVISTVAVILRCYAPGTPPASVKSVAIVPPDTTGPAITITRPTNGASYAQGQPLTVAFSCSDPAGVASCTGSQPNGSTIDTSTPGNYTFTVNATDNKGNTSSVTSSYAVVNLPLVLVRGGTRREAAGPVPFTVTLTKPANVSVNLATADGSATATSDYTAKTTTVSFTASGPLTQTVNVDLQDDAVAESPENFSLNVTGTTGDSVAVGTSAPGRVIDDDQGGDIAASCGSATEGSPVTCKVRLLRVPTVPTTVTYSTSNDTATGSDYTSQSGSLTFNPGTYPMVQSISVPTATDSVYEGDFEEFGFSADLAGGGSATAKGVIAEGTTVPAKMYIQDLTVKETDPGGTTTNNVRVRFTLDKPATGPVTVSACPQTGGTATANVDFNTKCPPPFTFQPGQIWKELALGVRPDNTPESDETFSVKLFNMSGPALMADDTGVITIVDDDNPTSSTVDVSIADASVWEGDQQGSGSNTNSVLVNISLSTPLAVPVVLNWQAIQLPPGAGAATKGDDFEQSTLPGTRMGSVKIGAGARTAQAKVNILPDAAQEGSELFRVFVFERNIASQGLNYLKPEGIVTLRDDDPLTPDPPSSLLGSTGRGDLGTVDLTWAAPANDGGSSVIDYEYRVSNDLDFDTEVWAPTGAGRRTSASVPGCGTACRVQVRAVTAAGQSGPIVSGTLAGTSDSVAPELELTTPVSGTNFDTAASPTFAGDSGILSTDLSGITVTVHNGPDTSGAVARTLTATASDGSFSVGTTPLSAGVYTAVATQTDWAGNVGTSNPVTFEVQDAIFVSPTGNDANAGTAAAPKKTVAAAITAAGANGKILLGAGSYAEASGGITPLNGQVLRGGFNQYFGWARPGTAGASGKPNPLDSAISAVGQALLVTTSRTFSLDGLALKGLNTGLGAGSSVYGVRATSGANVTLTNVSVSAEAAVAAAASTATGTNGTSTGCTGVNGPTSSSSNTASCNATTNDGRRAGTGGFGGGFGGSGGAGGAGGVTTPVNEPGGSGGAAGSTGILCIGGQNASGGIGGPGGAGGAAGTLAANDAGLAGATWTGRSGGTGGTGVYGRGGGGGGGGSCGVLFGSRAGNGGSGGGGGNVGGGGATGGAPGGGSFGIYVFNATVTVTDSSVTGGAGGAGGKGGAGGSGSNGGVAGNGGGARGAGGGGGGGAGGGGGGGGGAGGPSMAIFHTGTGGVTNTANVLGRAASAAAGGAGGNGGAGGAGGNGGGGPASGATGQVGNGGSNGQPGALGLLCKTYIGGTCTP